MNNKTAINIDQLFLKFYAKIDVRFKAVLLSAFIWGIIAHGMMLFNKYAVHDDIFCAFDIGGTCCLGRWFLEILGKITSALFWGHYSTPLFNGCISILLIAVSCYFVTKILRIKSIVMHVLIMGLMISFPVITNLFGYMFTIPYYMFSLLLATIGVYVLNQEMKLSSLIVGVLLICCSIGIYQAYIPYILSLLLLCFIDKIYENETEKTLLFRGIYFVCAVALALVVYFVCVKISLLISNENLRDYQGVSTMGQLGIGAYLNRLAALYTFVWNPRISRAIYPMNTLFLYRVTIVVVALFLLRKIVSQMKEQKIYTGLMLLFSVICFPICFDFIYVMCDKDAVHQLMRYGEIMPFIALGWLSEKEHFEDVRWGKFFGSIAICVLLSTSLIYCRFANVVYMRAEFIQSQLISYCSTLITQIKSCAGYNSEYPVVFIGNRPNADKSIANIEEFRDIFAIPWWGLRNNLLFNYSVRSVMRLWCGYNPKSAEVADFKSLPEVKMMPVYPENGGIKVIKNTVVVKLEKF